ncbi:outer membrane receptor protein [Spongiibacter sp. IMCC21906]|uniref:TonB-dependent receptor n=1 Tax=Spongiibacter sp. IMCC21906 TaxID=1620392 RepID=UPI00062DF114|nr:TonB-dependent receptor [Spongiibacter sp. IMCC21906]AKH68250.1 outer membrane receptor protein [Spongiibacter sp. IMCC21906]
MKNTIGKLSLICLTLPAAANLHAASRESTALEEVVVTAERRSQSIQDIPASISAFDENAIRDGGIVDVSAVAPKVPGFYAGGFGTSRPQLYIRGIGTRQFDPGSESSIGVFVDDAYLGRTGGVLGTLKDVQRIEVLKGPQGTLYGRNVIGGVINVVTKGPTDEFEAEVEAGIGNYNSKNLFGAVSGPLDEEGKIKGRAALWHSYREGYMTNLNSGEHPQGLDNTGGRLRLDFTPTDRLRIGLIGEFAEDSGDSFQGESIGSTTNPDGTLLGTGSPTKSGNKFKQFYNTDTDYNREINAFNAKIEYDFDAGTLVSISTFRDMTYVDDRDFDNTDLDVMRQISDEDSEQLTQEIRFVSNPDSSLSFDGKVDWIVGFYYFQDESVHTDTFLYGEDAVIYDPSIDQVDVTGGDFDTTSTAYFGQATINLSENLDMTLGLRYTKDQKESVMFGTTTDASPLVSADFNVVNPESEFTSTDPKIVFNYRLGEDASVFASYSQGFKSGGYQYTPLTASQASIVFDPEELEAYEVGFKSQWLGRSLTFNGSVYQFDYTDIQVSRVVELADGSTPSLIDNAGESRIRGLELDLLYRPLASLTLSFAYAYTDAKYLSYVASEGVDYSDTRMVRAPEHSFNIGAEYYTPIGNGMDLILRADYAYNDEFFHEPGEADAKYGSTAPFTKEDAYGLASLRATVTNDEWRFSLWANNVLDEEYRSTILALPGQVINIYGLPRTFGASVSWTY